MMPNTRKAMLGIAVIAVAVLALPAHAQQKANRASATSKKLYCWDQNGQRVCSDTLPSDALDRAREEFNANSGTRSAAIDRALSAEERAAATAAAAQAQADLAAEQTRKRTEQALLTTFQSEDDLRRVFAERTALIDNNVQTARYNVTSLRDGLITLLREAGNRELAGQKVADKLAKDIQARHRELVWQQRLQASFERQRAELDGEIEQIIARYRVMRAPQSS